MSLDDASDDLKFAELEAEGRVRRVFNRCRELDGDRAGPICQALFPDGLTVVLLPQGANQKLALERLRATIHSSNLAELAAHKDALVAVCDEAIGLFAPAFDAWRTAKDSFDRAYLAEAQRRDEHRRTVDAIFGGIRQALPRDRRLQDAIVPQVEAPPRRAPDDDGDDDGPPPA